MLLKFVFKFINFFYLLPVHRAFICLHVGEIVYKILVTRIPHRNCVQKQKTEIVYRNCLQNRFYTGLCTDRDGYVGDSDEIQANSMLQSKGRQKPERIPVPPYKDVAMCLAYPMDIIHANIVTRISLDHTGMTTLVWPH